VNNLLDRLKEIAKSKAIPTVNEKQRREELQKQKIKLLGALEAPKNDGKSNSKT
jgi:hypothetical protein